MGGDKKKSAAQQEKSQGDKTPKEGSKKGKRADKGKGESSQKAEISVILTDEQANKIIKNSKAITVQDLARQTGVKVSAANAYLRQALAKGAVKKVGGYSGHHVYVPA